MIVDCAHYQDGSRQHEGQLPIEEVEPELGWELGYPAALALIAGVGGGLYRFLRRAGWL